MADPEEGCSDGKCGRLTCPTCFDLWYRNEGPGCDADPQEEEEDG